MYRFRQICNRFYLGFIHFPKFQALTKKSASWCGKRAVFLLLRAGFVIGEGEGEGVGEGVGEGEDKALADTTFYVSRRLWVGVQKT